MSKSKAQDTYSEIITAVAGMAEDRQWSHSDGWQALGTLAASLFHSEAVEQGTPDEESRREFLRYIDHQMEQIQSREIILIH